MTALASLQACPFCGDQHPGAEEISPGRWAVCCTFCRVIGPHPLPGIAQSFDEAVREWNTRMPPQP